MRRPWHLGTATGFLPCYFPLLSFRTPVRHQIQRYLLSSLPAARAIQQCASWRTLGSNRASHSGSSALRPGPDGPVGDHGNPERPQPVAFGTYTRLTGRAPRGRAALHPDRQVGPLPARSTMRPSIPAVLRPALSSVTCRTLTRALLRDRSISFCRLRTFSRSPACDAVKILRLSRRTFPSAWPQSTESQPGLVLRSVHFGAARPGHGGDPGAPSHTGVEKLSTRVQLAPRLWRPYFFSPQAHLPTSALFRAGHQALSGQLCGSR